jgi:nitric oxide reductase large subunit
MGLAYDGLLGLHILFALIWIVTTFIGTTALLQVTRSPGDSALRKRALLTRTLIAASGGVTVLLGIAFYYYINVYRTIYATGSAGLPLIDTGALVGLIVFAWQMAQGPRIRRALKEGTTSGGASGPASNIAGLPKSWMLVLPALLLLVAFALMIGGSMM